MNIIIKNRNGSEIVNNKYKSFTEAIEKNKANLRGADLRGAYLREANLLRADLQGANLQGANLWEANLQEANLLRAYLQGAYLQGAYLQGAYLQGAYLQGAYLQGANLQGADLLRAYLQGAYLQGAYLQGAYLQGADLQEANLRGANLRGANLREANLREADLREADLREADLQGANLQGADLWGAKGMIKIMGVEPGNIYWKRFDGGLNNNGYQFYAGLNTLREGENFANDERRTCSYPGFHFASRSWCALYYSDRPLEAKIRIPMDAQINEPWATDGKASADKIEILQVFEVKTGKDVTDQYKRK
jgi:uncharacterized protein YjbI with pentapeptide repeats